MASPDTASPTTPAPVPAKPAAKKAQTPRVVVFNNWNQIVNVVLSDGSERQITSKGSIEVDADKVSDLMNTLQARGVIRLKPVAT